MRKWEPECRACNDSGWANHEQGVVCPKCQPPDPVYAFVDNGAIPVTVREVADFCRGHNISLRSAAPHYGVSPSTLSRFMRRNGYAYKIEWGRAPTPEGGE